jgi:hypothetical protein
MLLDGHGGGEWSCDRIAILTARGVETKAVVFGKARIREDQAGLETAVSPVSSG